MALANLPTELDTRILEYLHGQQALAPMLYLSKYYHEIAEQIMYRDIQMSYAPGSKFKRLLMILIGRPELVAGI